MNDKPQAAFPDGTYDAIGFPGCEWMVLHPEVVLKRVTSCGHNSLRCCLLSPIESRQAPEASAFDFRPCPRGGLAASSYDTSVQSLLGAVGAGSHLRPRPENPHFLVLGRQ